MNIHQITILVKTPQGYKNNTHKGIVASKKRTPIKLIQKRALERIKEAYSNENLPGLQFEIKETKKLKSEFIINVEQS